MKKLYFSLVILLSLSSSTLFAQDFEITLHDLEDFHSFPTTLDFAEDAEGNLWFIQSGGFDGDYLLKFAEGAWERVSFDGCSNCFYKIATDKTGVLHLSTSAGLFKYVNSVWEFLGYDEIIFEEFAFDSQNNIWATFRIAGIDNLTRINTDGTIDVFSDYQNDVEEIIVDSDDKVWFTSGSEIIQFDGNNDNRYEPFNSVFDLENGEGNVIWFTTSTGKIGKIENGVMTENLFPSTSNQAFFTSYSFDPINGIHWMGTQVTAGVTFLRNGVSDFIDAELLYPGAVGLTNRSFVSSDGCLWVASNFESRIAQIFATVILSTEDIQTSNVLYPNPSIDFVKIDQIENIKALTIHDSNGRQVRRITQQELNQTLDVSTLTNGNYYIHIVDNQGKTQTQKFIIHR